MAKDLLALGVFLLLAFGAAAIGASFPPGPWYAGLDKPAFNPPNWIFAPVWTVLYLTIALAGWLVWRHAGGAATRPALTLWGAQLVLNALWSWLFFGLHLPGLALAEIALLWIAVVATVVAAWRVRPLAGALLLPYLGWVGFAAVLNGALWQLNR